MQAYYELSESLLKVLGIEKDASDEEIERAVLDLSYNVPPEFRRIEDIYERHESGNWAPGEINFSSYAKDVKDLYHKSPAELEQLKRILAFFSTGDSFVTNNMPNFTEEFGDFPVIVRMLNSQARIEDIHSKTYSQLIDYLPSDIVSDRDKIDMRLSVIKCPQVKAIADWITKYMDPETESLSARLFAFTILEYIIFSGCFCIIYDHKRKNRLGALTQANALIANDETQHADGSIAYYNTLRKLGHLSKLDQSYALNMLRTGVDITCDLMEHEIESEVVGLKNEDMRMYIQSLSNEMFSAFFAFDNSSSLDEDESSLVPFPGAENPFEWMVNLVIPQLTNFFEKDEVTYIGALNRVDPDELLSDDEVDF